MSIFALLFQRGYHGLGGCIGTLRSRELELLLKHQSPKRTVGEGMVSSSILGHTASYLLSTLRLVSFQNCPSHWCSRGSSCRQLAYLPSSGSTDSVNASSRFLMPGDHRPQGSSAFHTQGGLGLLSLWKEHYNSKQTSLLCWLGFIFSTFHLVPMTVFCSATTGRRADGNLESGKTGKMASGQELKATSSSRLLS